MKSEKKSNKVWTIALIAATAVILMAGVAPAMADDDTTSTPFSPYLKHLRSMDWRIPALMQALHNPSDGPFPDGGGGEAVDPAPEDAGPFPDGGGGEAVEPAPEDESAEDGADEAVEEEAVEEEAVDEAGENQGTPVPADDGGEGVQQESDEVPDDGGEAVQEDGQAAEDGAEEATPEEADESEDDADDGDELPFTGGDSTGWLVGGLGLALGGGAILISARRPSNEE